MADVTIRDYIGFAKELTAEQVKKLPAGTKVILHSFDRYSAHQTQELTVTQCGKKKILTAHDWSGTKIEKPIRTATDRFCYTEVTT